MVDPNPVIVKKKGPSVLLVLTALVLLAASVYVVAAFVPVVSCPNCQATGVAKNVTDLPKAACEPCKGTGILKQIHHDPKTGKNGMLERPCDTCGGSGVVKTGALGTVEGECASCKGKSRITLIQKFNLAPLDPSKLQIPDLKK